MTQLYIDNQEVALPENFTFDLIKENPFFTKGGSFTLDISLNLDIPVNARLYKHLNRFTASSNFKNRPARLIVDGKTVLNGTEIILEVNELSASIQLASGNSELNFLVGSDVKMNTLDLGDIPAVTSDQALKSRGYAYPTLNYICAPIKAMSGSSPTFINNLKGSQLTVTGGVFRLYWNEDIPEEIRVMPYLNYIIERCIIALGYTIGKNSIRNSVYNRLFIVHANEPKTYGELMPDKTVAEFLTEVEELLNVLFLVNDNKTVDILFAYEFYSDPVVFSVQMVSEQFERKYLNPDEQLVSHTTSNIRYDFNDSNISKEYDIDPDIRKYLKEIRKETKYLLYSEAIRLRDRTNFIFIDEATGNEFIVKNKDKGWDLRPVNTFRRISGPENADGIEIEIVPADTETLEVECWGNKSASAYNGYLQIPVVSISAGSEEIITAEDAIHGKTASSQALDKICVAFANPQSTFYVLKAGTERPTDTSDFRYPLITTHYNAPYVESMYLLVDSTHATLAFKSQGYGLYEQLYSKTSTINTKEENTIHAILDKAHPAPTDVFNVCGKKCVCKDIHFKITPDGFDPEYQATLYSMT